MNLKENISIQLKRRTHLLDRVVDNLLPNMYPCDYNSSDHFVEGVLDEIRWFLPDVKELQGIERTDIENYILDYKYDELTEYFNERCIVLKNNNLQESIRRILREELSGADKMKKQIHKMGLYQFMKLSGLSWADIVSIIGVDFLSYKMMADFIPNAINDTVGGFHLTEIDEDPISYSSNEYEERQINYLGANRAIVDVWGGNNFDKNLGEFGVHYYNLPDDILEQVFDIVMTVYEENKDRF